jgi:hypothetical protein
MRVALRGQPQPFLENFVFSLDFAHLGAIIEVEEEKKQTPPNTKD